MHHKMRRGADDGDEDGDRRGDAELKSRSIALALPLVLFGAIRAFGDGGAYPGEVLKSVLDLKALSVQKQEMPSALPEVTVIGTEEAEKIWKAKTATFLDTRPRAAYEQGRIPGAGWLCSDDLLKDPDAAKRLDRAREYVLYCNGDRCWRAAGVAILLRHLGFGRLRWYRAGYPVWRKEGLPTESGKGKEETGSIRGTIVLGDGSPLRRGKMVFFRAGSGPPPNPGKYLRPPDEMVDIGEDGSFLATLPAGRYHVTAIRKRGEDRIGPPSEGDELFPSPTDLQQGKRVYSVDPGRTTDIGTGVAAPFSKRSVILDNVVTSIEGTITGADGNPVRGAIAFAFSSANAVGRPLFLSEKTGDDGKYTLRVSEGGTYYVRTRTSLKGGHPEEKEVLGVHGGERPSAVVVRTGETVRGIDIRGRAFELHRDGVSGKNGRPGYAGVR